MLAAKEITSNQLTSQQASISGKLIAGEIESETTNQIANDINNIQSLLAEIRNTPLSDLTTTTDLSTTTDLTTNFNQFQPVSTSFNELTVTGNANLLTLLFLTL
jgi:hypothetical protein